MIAIRIINIINNKISKIIKIIVVCNNEAKDQPHSTTLFQTVHLSQLRRFLLTRIKPKVSK